MIFIPVIVLAIMGCFYATPSLRHIKIDAKNMDVSIGNFDGENSDALIMTATMAWWVAESCFYLVAEPKLGMITFVIGTFIVKTAQVVTKLDETENILGGQAFKFWMGVQLIGWIT